MAYIIAMYHATRCVDLEVIGKAKTSVKSPVRSLLLKRLKGGTVEAYDSRSQIRQASCVPFVRCLPQHWNERI
jgi:hypothetical protein